MQVVISTHVLVPWLLRRDLSVCSLVDCALGAACVAASHAQGCGIIVFEHITAALAAMEALHNKYHWTGGETTMVLEWADPSRQRRENPNTKGTHA